SALWAIRLAFQLAGRSRGVAGVRGVDRLGTLAHHEPGHAREDCEPRSLCTRRLDPRAVTGCSRDGANRRGTGLSGLPDAAPGARGFRAHFVSRREMAGLGDLRRGVWLAARSALGAGYGGRDRVRVAADQDRPDWRGGRCACGDQRVTCGLRIALWRMAALVIVS